MQMSGIYRHRRKFIQRLQQQPLKEQQRRRPPEGHGQPRRRSIIPQIRLIMEAAAIMAIVTAMTQHLVGFLRHVQRLATQQNVHHRHRLRVDLVGSSPVYRMFWAAMSVNLSAVL
jgi:hypothetical protein